MKKVALHIFDKIFIVKWYVVKKSAPYFLSKRKSVVFILKQFCCFQSLSCVWLFVTPRTAACQASLSFTISRILLEFISIELVMLSNHPILCHLLLLLPSMFPSIRFFFMSQLFTSGSTGASSSASVLLMNGLISISSGGSQEVFFFSLLLQSKLEKYCFFNVFVLFYHLYFKTCIFERGFK